MHAPSLLSWKKYGALRRRGHGMHGAQPPAAPRLLRRFVPAGAWPCTPLGRRCRRALSAPAAARKRARNAPPASGPGRAVCAPRLWPPGCRAPCGRRTDECWRRCARCGRRWPAGGRGAPRGPPGAAARCLFESGGRRRRPAATRMKTPPAAVRCKSAAFALCAAAHTINTAARPRPAAITC